MFSGHDAITGWTGLERVIEPAFACGGLTPLSPLDCPECAKTQLFPRAIKSVFWRGDDLILIRGIPAHCCADCCIDFVDDQTTVALEKMNGKAFHDTLAEEFVCIPAFRFGANVAIGDD